MNTTTTDHSAFGVTGFPIIVDSPLASSLPTDARPDEEAIQRVDRTLDRLEDLTLLLKTEQPYPVPPPDYDLPKSFKLSVVVPVYNEAATIREILARVRSLPLSKEIIVVDDDSTDGTRQILEPLEKLPELRMVYKRRNEGKGAALRTGLQHVTGDVVVVQDADLEYDPRDILPLLRPIVKGDADVVYGSRFLGDVPQDRSWIHRLGNGLLTRASNLLTGLRLTDMETCYKAFRRSVLCSVDIKQNRFGFEPEVTAKLARRGCRIQEVPITYNARSYEDGKKIGIKDLFNALYCIVRYGLVN